MNSAGVALFAERLNALGEVYEKKPIPKGALQIWVDALREFPTERVLDVLNAWPRKRNKFPTPSEVWAMANESGVEEREAKAFRERIQNQSTELPKANSDAARRHLENMRRLVADQKAWSRTRFVEHWRAILASESATPFQKQFAKEALRELRAAHRVLDQQREGMEQNAAEVDAALRVTGDGPAPRVPGEDDEQSGYDEYTPLMQELVDRAQP